MPRNRNSPKDGICEVDLRNLTRTKATQISMSPSRLGEDDNDRDNAMRVRYFTALGFNVGRRQ
jgi:hypothetical protein